MFPKNVMIFTRLDLSNNDEYGYLANFSKANYKNLNKCLVRNEISYSCFK